MRRREGVGKEGVVCDCGPILTKRLQGLEGKKAPKLSLWFRWQRLQLVPTGSTGVSPRSREVSSWRPSPFSFLQMDEARLAMS